MKKGIHPENYRPVVFKDMSNGDMFLTKSTAKSAFLVVAYAKAHLFTFIEVKKSKNMLLFHFFFVSLPQSMHFNSY